MIGGFLQDLQETRGNSAATQNARLAAIHALFRYASLQVPEHAALIARVLAVHGKRTARNLVSFLTRTELEALLAAPDRATWHGRRDHALLLLAGQTGLRVSETPQWSPPMKGGRTHISCGGRELTPEPQWSPPMKGGRTYSAVLVFPACVVPQWSPPMKGGRTSPMGRTAAVAITPQWSPPMKGGRTDQVPGRRGPGVDAAMEPAYERRENSAPGTGCPAGSPGRNGARL